MAHGLRILVVDVGNTSTALGQWEDGRITETAHCDGGYEEAAEQVRAWQAARPFGALAYVSVVPAVDAAWRKLAEESGLPFHALDLDAFKRALPQVTFDYPRPETIGRDRLADAAGAVLKYGTPVLVMDFGTAFTAAVVTSDGVWRGGVIAPGFPLMRDYLYERTAQLPRLDLGASDVPKIGRSTEEAMRFGMLVGYRGMVREIVSELLRNFKEPFTLVATGGFSRNAAAGIGFPVTVDPTLTLYGAASLCAQSLS